MMHIFIYYKNKNFIFPGLRRRFAPRNDGVRGFLRRFAPRNDGVCEVQRPFAPLNDCNFNVFRHPEERYPPSRHPEEDTSVRRRDPVFCFLKTLDCYERKRSRNDGVCEVQRPFVPLNDGNFNIFRHPEERYPPFRHPEENTSVRRRDPVDKIQLLTVNEYIQTKIHSARRI